MPRDLGRRHGRVQSEAGNPAAIGEVAVHRLAVFHHDARRLRIAGNRHVLQSRLHVANPDRQGQRTAGLLVAQFLRRVVAYPGHPHQAGLEAAEPGVEKVVGRARLAVKVGALERRLRPRRGARARDLLQQTVHDIGVARRNHPQFFVARLLRPVLKQHLPLGVGDLADQKGFEQIAAVGKHAIRSRHLQGRDRARAQRQGEVRRLAAGLEAKTGAPGLRELRADVVEHADGHHILRLRHGTPQADRPLVFAVIIFRLPRFAACLRRGEKYRRVVDHGERGDAFFQRGRVDEGLETRSRLAPGLGGVIELVAREVQAAHHRNDGAIIRVHRHEGRLHLRQLGDDPLPWPILRQPHHRAGAQLDGGLRLVRQPECAHLPQPRA